MFSRQILTDVRIEASPQRVWEVLTAGALGTKAADGGPGWNPFLKSCEGELAEGAQLTVVAQPPGNSPTTFKPTLLRVDPGKEIRWRGSLPLGLFTGEHYFRIEPVEGSTHSCRFVHGEDIWGLIIPVAGGILKSTEQGFIEMNEALKRVAEGQ